MYSFSSEKPFIPENFSDLASSIQLYPSKIYNLSVDERIDLLDLFTAFNHAANEHKATREFTVKLLEQFNSKNSLATIMDKFEASGSDIDKSWVDNQLEINAAKAYRNASYINAKLQIQYKAQTSPSLSDSTAMSPSGSSSVARENEDIKLREKENSSSKIAAPFSLSQKTESGIQAIRTGGASASSEPTSWTSSEKLEFIKEHFNKFGASINNTVEEYNKLPNTKKVKQPSLEDVTPYCVSHAFAIYDEYSSVLVKGNDHISGALKVSFQNLCTQLYRVLFRRKLPATNYDDVRASIAKSGQEKFDKLREPNYRVLKGDTWEKIGAIFNIKESVLREYNKKLNVSNTNTATSEPVVGSKITIPKDKMPTIKITNWQYKNDFKGNYKESKVISLQKEYKVFDEEDIDDIADTLNSLPEQLTVYNNIRPGAPVFKGQIIFIPPKNLPTDRG